MGSLPLFPPPRKSSEKKIMQEQYYETILKYIHAKYILEISKSKAITLCPQSSYKEEHECFVTVHPVPLIKYLVPHFVPPFPHKIHKFIPD